MKEILECQGKTFVCFFLVLTPIFLIGLVVLLLNPLFTFDFIIFQYFKEIPDSQTVMFGRERLSQQIIAIALFKIHTLPVN